MMPDDCKLYAHMSGHLHTAPVFSALQLGSSQPQGLKAFPVVRSLIVHLYSEPPFSLHTAYPSNERTARYLHVFNWTIITLF